MDAEWSDTAFTEREARAGAWVALGLRLLTVTVLTTMLIWANPGGPI
jgi:hypothetical protein